MSRYPPVEVKVWGDWACFTRPEMKVERVSYPVMTPSAVRGVLEAIFWKPEFAWQVREVWVLKDIKHGSILRNEVNSKASERMRGFYYAEEDRAQRHTLALRDVEYLIKADMVIKSYTDEDAAKWRDQFRRRENKGQCYSTPYLGCREFAAGFSEPSGDEKPISLTTEFGLMLFDMDYAPDKSGRGVPRFFRAKLVNGVMKIPDDLYMGGDRNAA